MRQIHHEDVVVGTVLASLDKGVMTPAHIMRWSAAIENWHRIHYDVRFAQGHDGLPDLLINGSWKQHVLVQLVKDGLGELGWLWKLKFRYKSMDLVGDSIGGSATVRSTRVAGGFGFVELDVQLHNQHGVAKTVGAALGVLPLRNGAPVPHPFVLRSEYATLGFSDD